MGKKMGRGGEGWLLFIGLDTRQSVAELVLKLMSDIVVLMALRKFCPVPLYAAGQLRLAGVTRLARAPSCDQQTQLACLPCNDCIA